MSPSVSEEVLAARTGVALWLRDDADFARIAGPDAAEWLHSQTSNDVMGLESGAGNANATLDRQGRLQGSFTIHRWEDEFWMLIDKAQVDHAMAALATLFPDT